MVRNYDIDLKISSFVAESARFFVFFSFGHSLYSFYTSYVSSSFGLITIAFLLGSLFQLYIYSQIVPTVYLYYSIRKESETNFNKLVSSKKFIDSKGNILNLNLNDVTILFASFINIINIIYTFISIIYSLISSTFTILNLFWFFYGCIQFYVFLQLVNTIMAYNDLAKEFSNGQYSHRTSN